jgi:hypothetical protein
LKIQTCNFKKKKKTDKDKKIMAAIKRSKYWMAKTRNNNILKFAENVKDSPLILLLSPYFFKKN